MSEDDPIILDFTTIQRLDHQEAILAFVCKRVYRFTKYITNTPRSRRIVKVYGSKLPKEAMLKMKYFWETADLVNEPSNIGTPQYITRLAKRLFSKYDRVRLTVLNDVMIEKEGLNLITAVGQASSKKPRMMIIEYNGSPSAPKVCLCGKGVIFDAGGVNLKTRMNDNFWSMKGDKTGGCIVLGMMRYFCETTAAVNLVAIVPLVENNISGHATNPGDIIKSHKGLTVEITNTDAEGRLILADAFSYSKRFNPKYLFDFATLTRWANSLHCQTSAIFFSADKKMHTLIDKLSEKTGERMWGMPTWMDSMQFCKSQVADLKNHDFQVNGTCSEGSGFMATMFLAHFVPCDIKNWIHFDITNNKNNHNLYVNSMNTGIELVKAVSSTQKQ